jgi:hypothetical protein
VSIPKHLRYLLAKPHEVMKARRAELRRMRELTTCDALEAALRTYRPGLTEPRRVFLDDQLAMEKFYFRLLVEAEHTSPAESPHLFAALGELETLITRTCESRKYLLWEKAGLLVAN